MGFFLLQLLYIQKSRKSMKEIDSHILIRYFLGQASEEEKDAIHQWIEEDEEHRKRFIRERIRFDASVLADEPMRTEREKKRSALRPWMIRCMEMAACLLLLLGGFYLYDAYKMRQWEETFQTVYVPAGNRTHLRLADGTNVWLNSNTTFRYPVIFSRENREVRLDGEAYLEVAKDDSKSFVVKTEKYDVEVLGTVFDVEAYAGKPDFRTTLYEGKVRLYDPHRTNPVSLSPGQTAELVDGRLRVSATKDVNAYRWKDGLIYIEDKSFDEIMQLFEKFYAVQIVVNNRHVKALGYRGKLRVSDGVDHALRVLQNDFPFVYKRDEEKNIIYIN